MLVWKDVTPSLLESTWNIYLSLDLLLILCELTGVKWMFRPTLHKLSNEELSSALTWPDTQTGAAPPIARVGARIQSWTRPGCDCSHYGTSSIESRCSGSLTELLRRAHRLSELSVRPPPLSPLESLSLSLLSRSKNGCLSASGRVSLRDGS